jgi:hypothetical protein
MGDIVKLNLGCGNAKKPGAINVDLRGCPDIVTIVENWKNSENVSLTASRAII